MIACNCRIKCMHIKPNRISLQQQCRSCLKGSKSLPVSTVQVCQDLGVEYHAGFFQHLVDVSIGVMPRAPTIYRTSCFDRIASYYFTHLHAAKSTFTSQTICPPWWWGEHGSCLRPHAACSVFGSSPSPP